PDSVRTPRGGRAAVHRHRDQRLLHHRCVDRPRTAPLSVLRPVPAHSRTTRDPARTLVLHAPARPRTRKGGGLPPTPRTRASGHLGPPAPMAERARCRRPP